MRALMRKAPSRQTPFVVMKLTHRRQPADTHQMPTVVPDQPQRSRAEKIEPVCLRQRLGGPRWLRWRNTMCKINDTSKLGHAALDHCRLADTELDAVSGGFGEIFLAGTHRCGMDAAHLRGAERSIRRRHGRAGGFV